MAAERPQDYASHRRYDPLWHFVGFNLVMLGMFAAFWRAVREGGNWNWWGAAFALGVLLVAFRARAQTLIVQDRLIRLEMRLRMRDVLPAALHGRITELTSRQMVGLRFASDAELPSLVERCLAGELGGANEVKKAIKNWQPDWLRA